MLWKMKLILFLATLFFYSECSVLSLSICMNQFVFLTSSEET